VFRPTKFRLTRDSQLVIACLAPLLLHLFVTIPPDSTRLLTPIVSVFAAIEYVLHFLLLLSLGTASG
jgi:hypothetical protein